MGERRPYIPVETRLEAALLQLGLDPAQSDLDHEPPLGLRERTPEGGYIPAANDPRYLVWRARAAHRVKTSGTKATSAGSDIHKIAKSKRVAAEQEAFRRRMLAKDTGAPAPAAKAKHKIPSRPLRSGNNLRRRQ